MSRGIWLHPLLTRSKEQQGEMGVGAKWVSRNTAQSTVDQRVDWSKEEVSRNTDQPNGDQGGDR